MSSEPMTRRWEPVFDSSLSVWINHDGNAELRLWDEKRVEMSPEELEWLASIYPAALDTCHYFLNQKEAADEEAD